MSLENRGPELQVVCYTLATAAIVACALRSYTRLFVVKSFGVDDGFMIAALITFCLFCACALVGVHYGTGRHSYDLEKENEQQAKKFWWFCYIWYCLTMISSKISIGYFLLRITIRRLDIWIIYGVMLITILTGVVFFFVTMFQCSPIPFFWDKDIAGGHCISIDIIIALTYLYSVCSVICDFTFAILPMVIVWKLSLNKRSKIALVPILAMACIASAAVVVRFPYVHTFKDPDFLWATVDIAIWSCAEGGLAITAGSLATLRPLLRNVGYCFGLSSPGPTELKDTDPRAPSATIGGQSSRRKPSQLDAYNLTEIDRENSNTSEVESGQRVFGGLHGDKRIAPWESQGTSQDGSEDGIVFSETRASGQRWDQKGILQVHTVTVSAERP